jgi:MATE family multidrug resistance protein
MFSLTTLRQLFHLALPMVVSQGAFAAMIFVDRYFMSRIDATHIAAALGGGVTYYVSVSLFSGVIAYANALVAQHYGAGDLSRCPRVATQGLIIAIACQPILLIIAWFMPELFVLMGHEPVLVELEQQYYFVLMAGAFFMLAKTAIACYFSGIGRTRVVMIADLLGVLVNVPLTYGLVFGKFGLPAMGIQGAALGTVVAMAFSIAVFLVFYFNKVHRQRFSVMASFQWDFGLMRRYIRLGLPSGFETFVGAGTFNLFLLLYQGYGINEGAAMAIVFNWDMLSFVPMVGLNIAIMSLIGRHVGAGDLEQVNKVITSGYILALLFSGSFALVFVLLRVELMEVFATPGQDFSEIIELGSRMMLGLATYTMADACILVASGVLRGAGDTRWLMVTSIVMHLLMLVVQILVIRVFDWSPLASWWCFVVTLLSIGAVYSWRVQGGVWRQPERLARVMAE